MKDREYAPEDADLARRVRRMSQFLQREGAWHSSRNDLCLISV